MDKETLRKAAEQLMEAEYLCRKAYAQADKAGWAKFEEAQQKVKKLTESVTELQRSIPELSSKRYWWETPFHPQEQVDTTGFRFDDGKYLECDSVSLREESHGTFLYQKPKNIDYNSLSLEFTLGTNIPLFINRKQLRNHLNDWMNCRYLYDTVLIRREVQVVPDLTRKKESASAAWKQYQQMEKEKRAEYQEYLKSHNETWDQMEKFRHLSLFTNEERWLMGQMDTDDYIREDNWRNYATYGQRDKMREELAYMNLQASKASQDVRQRQMEARRNALRMSAS